jgi:hypothetical protein
MISVTVDLSNASRDEVQAFLGLPGVGRAIDALAQSGKCSGIHLRIAEPQAEQPRRLDHGAALPPP